MEFVWVLTVCGGLNGWGCGSTFRSPMPSYEACIQQAEISRPASAVGALASGEDGNSSVVICQLLDIETAKLLPHPRAWRIGVDGKPVQP
jgi:hypothetical protein